MPKRTPKRGRRPGASNTSETILARAATAFARNGYDGVTVREIAVLAGVDPALIFHYFTSKRALFEASIDIPDLATIPSIDLSKDATKSSETDASIGQRIVHAFLGAWDGPSARATLAGLVRSASADAEAKRQLIDVIERTVVVPAIAGIDANRGMPKLRAALVASQLIGLAFVRYVLALEPIASASPAIIARTYGSSVGATLRGSDYGAKR